MIEVVEYDARWPAVFEELRTRYAMALELAGVHFIGVEHVGSTSVPGLAAKPVIDIDIIVAREQVQAASQVLITLGFEPRGELGIVDRWAFREPSGWPRTNTYVILEGSLALANRRGVRDLLRQRPDLCEEYAAAKRHAAGVATDIDAYGRAKNATVQRILAEAGLSDDDRATIDRANTSSQTDAAR